MLKEFLNKHVKFEKIEMFQNDDDICCVAQQLVDGIDVFTVNPTDLPQEVYAARQKLEAKTYALASNTQHVEGGVHLAKVVAGPGRFEPLRSALEIIRSMWNVMNRNEMKSNPKKSLSFVEEVEEQYNEIEKLKNDIGVDFFEMRVESVAKLCRENHYKKIRINSKKEKHIENLDKPDKKFPWH